MTSPMNQPKENMPNFSPQHSAPAASNQQSPDESNATQAVAPSPSPDRSRGTTDSNLHRHPQRPETLTRRRFVSGALALAAAALGTVTTGCNAPVTAAPEALKTSDPEKPRYVSPYNWEGLVRTDGRWGYLEDGQLRSRWGIDVSEHQKAIDWEQVAGASVDFAFVRIGNRGASQGQLRIDDYFLDNATGAGAAGIQTEGYFFSQALTEVEAEEEAALAIQQAQEANAQGASIAMIAFDHEPVEIEGARANTLSPEQLTANARAFCAAVEAAGFSPAIYGNRKTLFKLSEELRASVTVWLAEYNVPTPTAPLDFRIWQYSCTGTVPGITTDVDLNIWLDPPGQGSE